MTEFEILEKYTSLSSQLLEECQGVTFELNPRIAELQKAIKELRQQCPHSMVKDGHCMYCYKKVEEKE